MNVPVGVWLLALIVACLAFGMSCSYLILCFHLWRERSNRKVYLASRYKDRPTMLRWKTELECVGYKVTSRWINGSHEITTDATGDEDRQRFAKEDLADVVAAGIFLCHSDRSFFRSGRGGRHVEFGVAVATGKRIIMVGERENVFHWLPGVEVYPTIEKAIDSLTWRRER